MHSFSTSWKDLKKLRFSNVFRGQKNGALGKNGLKRYNVFKDKITYFAEIDCQFNIIEYLWFEFEEESISKTSRTSAMRLFGKNS